MSAPTKKPTTTPPCSCSGCGAPMDQAYADFFALGREVARSVAAIGLERIGVDESFRAFNEGLSARMDAATQYAQGVVQ